MLVLNRKPGQSITIGEDIEIKFLETKSKHQINLGIQVPKYLDVIREKVIHETASQIAINIGKQ